MQNETKTNFFSAWLSILQGSTLDVTLTLRKQGDHLVVGVRPQQADKNGTALNAIRPLVLTHSATDLDESFFATITEPINAFDQAAKDVAAYKEELKKATTQAKEDVKDEVDKEKKKKTSSKPAPQKKAAPAKKKPEVKKKEEPKVATPAPAPVDKNRQLTDAYIKDIKAHMESGTATLDQFPSKSLDECQKAETLFNKMLALKANTQEEADSLKGLIIDLKKAAEKKIREKLLKELAPTFDKAQKLIKGANFGDGAAQLKKVLADMPDHEGALALKAELTERLGEPTVTELLKK